jgi:hypothetical protein
MWLELDLNGTLTGQWTYAVGPQESILPTAFDSKDMLYGRRSVDLKLTGIAVFDKITSTWKPVESLPKRGLLGADGTRLVYQHGDQLQWVQGLNTELVESAATLPLER